MLIIEVALGIVLGVLILAFLPQILEGLAKALFLVFVLLCVVGVILWTAYDIQSFLIVAIAAVLGFLIWFYVRLRKARASGEADSQRDYPLKRDEKGRFLPRN